MASVRTAKATNVSTQTEPQFTKSALRHMPLETTMQAKRARCERSAAPEALATPDPLLDLRGAKTRIAVSFIIGADGRVHSPIILESAGRDEDRSVLDAVLAWRYRPAMCNAEPTETESKVEFWPQ